MVEPLANLLITARGLVRACLASRATVAASMVPAFDDAIQVSSLHSSRCLIRDLTCTLTNSANLMLLTQAMETMLAQILERLTASQLTDWGLDSSCNTSRKSTVVTSQTSFMISFCLLSWHIILPVVL